MTAFMRSRAAWLVLLVMWLVLAMRAAELA